MSYIKSYERLDNNMNKEVFNRYNVIQYEKLR